MCGSVVHPAPAKLKEGVLAQGELSRQKKIITDMEAKQKELHGELAGRKSRADDLRQRIKEKEEKLSERKKALSEEQNQVCLEYLAMEPDKAEALLSRRCGRAREIKGLLQEKERTCKRLKSQGEELMERHREAKEAFETAYQDMINQLNAYNITAIDEAYNEVYQQYCENMGDSIEDVNADLY